MVLVIFQVDKAAGQRFSTLTAHIYITFESLSSRFLDISNIFCESESEHLYLVYWWNIVNQKELIWPLFFT